MLKATATNLASGESLDLNEISLNGAGVEAIAGMTGLGLPPVEVQWFEGAGDGAQARNVRVQPRDVDIPLWVSSANRTALKAKVKAISRVFCNGTVRITLTDDTDGSVLYADFMRVGGGAHIYGVDTTGETDWTSVMTLRAGNPYWALQNPVSITRAFTATDSFTLTNNGAVSALPKWTFQGPLTVAEVTNTGTGQTFKWTGNLNQGDTLTIDSQAGTVKDQTGANRYAGMSTSPDLFALRPGNTAVTVKITKPALVVRRNYVTNPSFEGGTHDWTVSDDSGATSSSRVAVVTAGDGSKYLQVGRNEVTGTSLVRVTARKTITGLPVGATLQLRADFRAINPAATSFPPLFRVWLGGPLTAPIADYTTNTGFTSLDFTVPASGSIQLEVQERMDYGNGVVSYGAIIDKIYVGLAGSYFDGSTPDAGGIDYAWVGTANASQSTATPLANPNPSVSVGWQEREWMVV